MEQFPGTIGFTNGRECLKASRFIFASVVKGLSHLAFAQVSPVRIWAEVLFSYLVAKMADARVQLPRRTYSSCGFESRLSNFIKGEKTWI